MRFSITIKNKYFLLLIASVVLFVCLSQVRLLSTEAVFYCLVLSQDSRIS